MPIPTRRQFAGAVALAAAASTIAQSAIAATTQSKDRDMLQWCTLHAVLSAQAAACEDAVIKAEEAAEEAIPPKPEALRIRRDDWHITGDQARAPDPLAFHDADSVERWRAGLASGVSLPAAFQERFTSRGAELVAAWDARRSAVEAAYARFEVDALEKQANRVRADLHAVERRILETRARTPEELRLKATIVRKAVGEPIEGESATYEDRALRSLLDDLAA